MMSEADLFMQVSNRKVSFSNGHPRPFQAGNKGVRLFQVKPIPALTHSTHTVHQQHDSPSFANQTVYVFLILESIRCTPHSASNFMELEKCVQ